MHPPASIIARKHPSPLPAHHVRQWANPARGKAQGAASGPRWPCLTTRAEARSRKPRRPPVRSWLICASLPCSGSGFPGLCPGSQLALGLRLKLSHSRTGRRRIRIRTNEQRAASSELLPSLNWRPADSSSPNPDPFLRILVDACRHTRCFSPVRGRLRACLNGQPWRAKHQGSSQASGLSLALMPTARPPVAPPIPVCDVQLPPAGRQH